MSRKGRSRVYARHQGGVRRYYLDCRDFADVGGRREALIPPGGKQATSDELLAQVLAAQRLEQLEMRRRRRAWKQPEEDARLAQFARYHVEKKSRAGLIGAQWVEAVEHHLETAVRFFVNEGNPVPKDSEGKTDFARLCDVNLESLTVSDVQEYDQWLATQPNGRGGTLSPSSRRKFLNSLSNLYRRAISEGRVAAGRNPVTALLEKPQDSHGRVEAKWLEVPDAALLLESARTFEPKRRAIALDPAAFHAVLATMLITGGRPSEVLGLQVGDISFERRLVTFRPNAIRRLKTRGSCRSVPLFSQLFEILSGYLTGRRREPGELLFPSHRTGDAFDDLRKRLDAVASRVGWRPGEIRPYRFRHTFTAARLQTLDGGHPISPFTVARELGHGGMRLVDKTYGHLGECRHRSEEVEYRVSQHVVRLAPRLVTLHSASVQE